MEIMNRKEMLEYIIRASTEVTNEEIMKQSQLYFKELIKPIYREVEWLCANYFDIMSKIYPPAPPKDLIYDRLISVVFNEIHHNIVNEE